MDSRAALARASALAQAGRLEAAEQQLRQVFGAAPKDPAALHLSGLIALRRGRLSQAIRRLGKAVAAAPDPAARTNLGIALAQAGRLDEAVAELRRAAQGDAPHPPALCNLGVALVRQNQRTEAVAVLRRAVTLQPDYTRAWFELGVALQDQEPGEAIACYQQVLAQAPRHADALYNSAILSQAQGDFSAAAAHFEACLAQAPERGGAWLALGCCRQECGDHAAALDAYRTALRHDPKLYPAVLKSLATASKGRLWLDPAVLRRELQEPRCRPKEMR